MQSVLALGLLMSLCVSATAAPVHRSKRPHGHLRSIQRVTVPDGYAVPGWTFGAAGPENPAVPRVNVAACARPRRRGTWRALASL
jgi:hypothetical protein